MCLTAVLHSASFMARLRSTSLMTMFASWVSRVVLSALNSRGLVSRMHLQGGRTMHIATVVCSNLGKQGDALKHTYTLITGTALQAGCQLHRVLYMNKYMP